MITTDIDRKIFMAESFLDSAICQEKTSHAILVEGNEVNTLTPEELEEKLSYTRLRKKVTTHFLCAMVVELSIKIIWEIEHGQQAPHTHNILKLYKALSQAAQQRIADMYQCHVTHVEKLISEMNGQKNRGGERVNLKVQLQSLKEALAANEQVVTSFKYEGRFNGKSSALCSVLWTDTRIMVLPSALADAITFPQTLFAYAVSLTR